LKYPEGLLCAEVLKAGASAESRAASIESEKIGSDEAATRGGKVIAAGFRHRFSVQHADAGL
jgi:uncharacterized oligopeptide transporter (OPT) family protein